MKYVSTWRRIKYNTVPDSTYAHIDEWLEWYQGDVEKFPQVQGFNGTVTTEQKRYTMGMAKKVCEDWANLLLNEKVAIKAGDYDKRLQEILSCNNFSCQSKISSHCNGICSWNWCVCGIYGQR